MMKVGGKAKLICPSDIAYGDHGSPPKIKPGATLVFEVELLDIEVKSRRRADCRKLAAATGSRPGSPMPVRLRAAIPEPTSDP